MFIFNVLYFLRFHVGCAYDHPDIYARTIEEARAVFDVGAKLGFQMTILDIGGGFPGGTRKVEKFLKVITLCRFHTKAGQYA